MPNVMQQLFIMNIESLLKEYAAYRAFNKADCVIHMRIPRPNWDGSRSHTIVTRFFPPLFGVTQDTYRRPPKTRTTGTSCW